MNSLVAEYRNRRPDDTRSDEELTLLLGRAHDVDGRYAGYPDFVEEYQSTKARLAKEEVPFKSEFRRGLKRGVSGLKQSAVGAGALAADVVGAESLRDTALEKYRDLQAEDASVNAPGVARIEDVGSVSDLARYVMGKGGELVPQIAEAAIAGVAGAAAGSAAAPGPGTVAGGVGGFLSRRAAKKILSEGIEAVLEKRGLAAIEKEIVKDQLKNVAERKVISDAIRPEVVDLLNLETKSMLSKGGALGAELSNFYGIGAGTIYGETANREGVDKADARRAALVGGIGSAIANAPLPLMVISRFFPGASQAAVRSYMQRLASDAAKEIPMGAGGEVLDELFQIAAEKYADPKLRDTPLSDEDLSRLLNAGVVGGFAGAAVSPASAIPSSGFHPVVEQHFRNVPEDRRRQIAALVVRSERGEESEQDIVALRSLTPEERNFATVFSAMPQSERDKFATASTGQYNSTGGKPGQSTKAAADTTTAGAAATAPASIFLTREEASAQGPDAVTAIMSKHGVGRDVAVATLAKWRKEYGISKEVASTISDETHKALEDLGYNEQERNNLRPEEAQSIIDNQLESPRRQFQRAAVTATVTDPAVTAARAKVSEAAAKTNTNPTEKQKETGQYKKGTVNIDGFNIAIENPVGSERSGKDASGKPWSVQMLAHYGYFTDSVGSDGDKLDVYVGPNPTSQKVFVIDQTKQDGSFDETKTMFGFDSKEQAIAAYDSAFSDGRGPRLRGEVTEITKERLREWVNSKQTKKPFAYQTTPIKQIATIGSLNSQQFASMAAEHKSMQVHAYKFGASLKDQSELTALEIGKKAAEKELNEAKKRVEDAIKSGNKDAVAADVSSIGPLIAKTQWFSEAIEAATGVEKSSITEVLGKDYVAPFGKKKEEPKPAKKPALTKEEQAELAGVEVNEKDTVRKKKDEKPKSETVSERPAVAAADVAPSAEPVAETTGTIGGKSRDVTLDDIGFAEKVYKGEGIQRGWFRTGGEVTNREIETKLVSEYSPDSDEAKTNTHRISAVLDRKTGKVHLLSTYSTHGKIMITKPDGGKRPGVAVATMLAAKLKDGSNRYQVIGSAYTKETTNFLNQQFPSLEQFEAQFGKPADEAMDHAVGQARAVGAIVPEGAKKGYIKKAVNEIGLGKPARVKLSTADIELLKTIPRFDSPEEFTDLFLNGELSPEQVELIHRVGEQDIGFFERMRRMGLKDTLKEYGYEIGNEANQRPRRKGKPAPVSEQADVVPPVGKLGESPDGGPEADLEGEQDSIGEPGQEGDGGDEESDPTGDIEFNRMQDGGYTPPNMMEESRLAWSEVFADFVGRGGSAHAALGTLINSGLVKGLNLALAERLYANGDLGVKLVATTKGINARRKNMVVVGRYSEEDSSIVISDLVIDYGSAIETFLHEYTHAATIKSLGKASSDILGSLLLLRNEAAKKAKEAGLDFYVLEKFDGNTFVQVGEFVAGVFSDIRLQQFLESIDAPLSATQSRNLFSRFVNFVAKLLGVRNDSALYHAIKLTDRVLHDSEPSRIGRRRLQRWRDAGWIFQQDRDFVDPDTDSGAAAFNMEVALDRNAFEPNAIKRKTEIEKVVAPINHLVELQDKIAKAIESNEALKKVVDAKEMPTMDWVRSIMKVADPKQTKELLKGWQEAGGGAIEYDANKTIDQFADKSNSDAVLKRAYQNTEAMLAKMSSVKADAELSLEQMGEKLKRQKDAIKKETEEYKNLAGQSTKFRRDIVQSFREVFSSISGLSRRKGIIEQQLAQLDAKLKIEDYSKAFESIVSNRVKNDVLFNTLEAMANDPEIDISKPIKKIRESMLGQPTKYALFLNDNSESRALLATAVAFAKTHAATMAELELRREKSGEKRAEIEQQINKVNAEKSEFIKDISSLAKTAKLEERARKARYDKLKRIRATEKSVSLAKHRIAVVDAAVPVISSELASLGAKMDIAADFTFADGATYLAVKPGMSSADAPKNAKRLVLDKSKRTITNPKQMESELLDMKSWLMAREEAYNNGDLSAKDSVYQFVNRQFHEIAGHLHYNLDAAPAERWLWEFAAMSEFKTIKEAFNTAAAQAFERMGNLYEVVRSALVREGTKVAHRVTQLEDELIKIAPMSRDVLRSQVLNPTKNLLQYHTEDLAEIHAGDRERLATAAYARVRKMLLDADYTKNLIGPKINEFMPVLRQLIEVQHDYNKRQIEAIENGVMVRNPITGRDERASVGVLDPKLKILDPTTGEMVSGIRRHMAVGPWTFSQKLSQEFNVMTNALRLSGWDKFQHIIGQYKEATENTPEFLGNVGEAYKEGGHDEASDLVSKFFSHPEHGDHVRNSFLRAVAEMPRSLFDAPIMDDGVTSVPANPDIVRQAINDVPAGDVIGFAERMFELHEGSGDKARYVQHVVQRLADIYKNVDGIERKTNPDPGSTRVRSIKGMTPGAMINAREIEDLPGSWFNYHDFDQRDVFRSSQNIASEIAFGRGQERGQAMVDTIANEIDDAIAKLQSERIRVQRINPGMTEQDLEKVVEKNLGQQYKQLKRFEERQHLLNKSVGRLSDYFRKDNSPDGTVRVATRAGSFLGALMVNNPGSALYQMSQLFDTMFRYGVSPSSIFATGRVVAKSVHELAASMMQAVGVEIGNNAEYQELRNELGLTDPAAAAKLKDSFSRWHGETTPAFAIRAAGDVIQAGINPVGERAQHVVFRLGGVFSMSTNIADWGLTYGMWKMTERFVARGIEHLRSNPAKLDSTEPLTWRDLGLKEWNGDRESFERLKSDMTRWGVDFDQMVRSAIKRGDGTAFTNEEALRLHSMAMSEISSQANLSTMTASAWNNSIMRFMIPLLGWSIRRTLDVSGKRLNQDGVTSMRAVGRGLAALSVISVGGLAISALVDRYYEDLLNKKRNLRPILSPAGFIEHTARLGQTGLFGELANGVINMGSGGDSRIISLDRRVVALSAFQTLQNTIAVMINQGEADYARVVRPLAASLGAGGLLQYMQLVNNVMGLDNAESRITARMNAQNYLRAGGRELGMDVRTFSGGGGAAHVTPMSPYISRMEMAAYGNNGVDFQIAYREAVSRAKDLGHDDPVDYVKRAFAARNPLRLVFQTPPSETEYRRLLNSLPEDGRNDVTEAVDHFNTFSQIIGARPFEGKRESVQKLAAPRFTTADFRQAALSFR